MSTVITVDPVTYLRQVIHRIADRPAKRIAELLTGKSASHPSKRHASIGRVQRSLIVDTIPCQTLADLLLKTDLSRIRGSG
jgi:hypothetical protein